MILAVEWTLVFHRERKGTHGLGPISPKTSEFLLNHEIHFPDLIKGCVSQNFCLLEMDSMSMFLFIVCMAVESCSVHV